MIKLRIGLLLLTVVPAFSSQMDSFAGLADGRLFDLLRAIDGSAIRRDFSVAVGDVVSFDWNYRSGDYDFDDPGWVSFNGSDPTVLGRTASTAPLSGGIVAPDGFWTGWQTHTHTITIGGTAFLTMGVNNSYDPTLPSWLGIDNLRINGTPIANSGFDNGGLSNWTSVGSVSAFTQPVVTNPGHNVDGNGDGNTHGDIDYLFTPTAGPGYALLYSTGAGAGGALGSSPQFPLLPVVADPTNPNRLIFTDIPTGMWSDPFYVDGFLYEGTGGTLFDSINFPIGGGFSQFSDLKLSTPGCTINDLFGNGGGNSTGFSFSSVCGGAVSSFSIFGEIGAFDADEHSAFPLQIFFDSATGSFTQTPQVVPEPATFAMCGLGIAILAWMKKASR